MSDPPLAIIPAGRIRAADCESIPLPQFNLGGVTYIARASTDTVIEADLGDVLGVQVGDIPRDLLRCGAAQLQNGQGSLGPGSHVYTIHGVDQSIAIAAEVDSGIPEAVHAIMVPRITASESGPRGEQRFHTWHEVVLLRSVLVCPSVT